ncbi:hypothetical protein GMOD_00002044 [Pyrenophora seminiperda CCB06]|uniref:Uncharacterized protein n=1 Tax=Pyrenophora seminiperda CCB06 TaxID=1302712 RepID=A0A3M7LWT0_9PLEO|nr:hypothetical protein GMOD_00002044 [Pyrenophora seminiperda CCB06]
MPPYSPPRTRFHTDSKPFPELPSLHNCPTPIAQLIDPAIHFLRIGPGLCTRDNLFGLGYLVLMVINCGLVYYTICVLLAIFAKLFGWYRGMQKMRLPWTLGRRGKC